MNGGLPADRTRKPLIGCESRSDKYAPTPSPLRPSPLRFPLLLSFLALHKIYALWLSLSPLIRPSPIVYFARMDTRYFGVLIGLLSLGCTCITAWPWRRELRTWPPYILVLFFFMAVVGLLAVLLVTANRQVRPWLLFALLQEAHCAEVEPPLSVWRYD